MEVIKRIYELQNIGKGVINSLLPENLLLISQGIPGIQDVLSQEQPLSLTSNIIMPNPTSFSIQSSEFHSFLLLRGYNEVNFPTTSIGLQGTEGISSNSLDFYDDKIYLKDERHSKGIEYAEDYEANFTERSLVTKQYVDEQLSSNQKIITYPTDFPAGVYILLPSDHNKLLIIKNGTTDVSIMVPVGLTDEQYTAFIRQGIGEVAIIGDGTTINSFSGIRINGTFQSVALDREGTTTIFYLTGNTKV